jgi:hypothetical protein
VFQAAVRGFAPSLADFVSAALKASPFAPAAVELVAAQSSAAAVATRFAAPPARPVFASALLASDDSSHPRKLFPLFQPRVELEVVFRQPAFAVLQLLFLALDEAGW